MWSSLDTCFLSLYMCSNICVCTHVLLKVFPVPLILIWISSVIRSKTYMMYNQTLYRKSSVLKQMSELLFLVFERVSCIWYLCVNRILTCVVIVFCHVEWIIHWNCGDWTKKPWERLSVGLTNSMQLEALGPLTL